MTHRYIAMDNLNARWDDAALAGLGGGSLSGNSLGVNAWQAAAGLGAISTACAQANVAGYGNVVTPAQWDLAEKMSKSSDPVTAANGKGMLADMASTCQQVLSSAQAQKQYLKETVSCDLTKGAGAEALQQIINDKLAAEKITFSHDNKTKSKVAVDGKWGSESCAGWVAAFDSGLDRGTIDSLGLLDEFKVFDACGKGVDVVVPTCAGPVRPAPGPPPPPQCPESFRFSVSSGKCELIAPPPPARPATTKKGLSKGAMWTIGGLLAASIVGAGAYMMSQQKKKRG
jgi:hypothetical protein